jgi:hypothetical protein
MVNRLINRPIFQNRNVLALRPGTHAVIFSHLLPVFSVLQAISTSVPVQDDIEVNLDLSRKNTHAQQKEFFRNAKRKFSQRTRQRGFRKLCVGTKL